MLDFRVETFLTVCRTMNYTRAAEELNITQPAVSQHIAHLERDYGVPLFAYRKKKLQLTDAGALLRDALSTMAHDERLLRDRMRSSATGARVELSLGMTLTAGEYLVAAPLADYLRRHPELHVAVRSGGTSELLALLNAGEIDCAFVEGFFDKNAYAWDVFRTERLVCVCAADHEFAARPVRVEDLFDERLIVREPGSGTRAVLEHALAAQNLTVDGFAQASVVESLDVIKIDRCTAAACATAACIRPSLLSCEGGRPARERPRDDPKPCRRIVRKPDRSSTCAAYGVLNGEKPSNSEDIARFKRMRRPGAERSKPATRLYAQKEPPTSLRPS